MGVYSDAKEIVGDVGGIVSTVFSVVGNATTTSVTQYTKPTNIISRAFIDQTIAHNPETNDLIKVLHNLYASMILSTLQMSQLVTSATTVKDLLRVVATEDLKPVKNDSLPSLEALSSLSMLTHDQLTGTMGGSASSKEKTDDKSKQLKPMTTGEAVEPITDGSIAIGKQIKVTFTNPNNTDHKVILDILIQVHPYIINAKLAPELLKAGTINTFAQRYLMWKAGELRFWKDLIFNADVLADNKRIMREDKDGGFATFILTNIRKNASNAARLFSLAKSKGTATGSANIANSIVIVSKDAVDRAKAEVGFNIDDPVRRMKYFADTMSMMVAVVDPMYNKARVYFNGISGHAEWTFDQLKGKSKGNDSGDLLKAIQAINQGKAPRF